MAATMIIPLPRPATGGRPHRSETRRQRAPRLLPDVAARDARGDIGPVSEETGLSPSAIRRFVADQAAAPPGALDAYEEPLFPDLRDTPRLGRTSLPRARRKAPAARRLAPMR